MPLGGVFREELWVITLPAPPGATLATPQASPTGKALLEDIGLRWGWVRDLQVRRRGGSWDLNHGLVFQLYFQRVF